MNSYVCVICGYVYDEAKGIPEAGISPGTKWQDVPEDWTCPLCGATKVEFEQQVPVDAEVPTAKVQVDTKPIATVESPADMKELSALEMSALCTNLASGCEKQYKAEEAVLFLELASYFKAAATPAVAPDLNELLSLVEKDLTEGFPSAKSVSTSVNDRGALRALVWSEKVTRILKSLISRYQADGDAMLENTSVYVCTICGFIYIGDDLPDVCPICKVPNWKFERIEGR